MLGFIIAAVAGFLTPQLEEPVAQPIMKAVGRHFIIAPTEKRLVAFMVALLAAGVLVAALDNGSVLGVISGAILGYFGTRIFAVLKKLIEGRTDR